MLDQVPSLVSSIIPGLLFVCMLYIVYAAWKDVSSTHFEDAIQKEEDILAKEYQMASSDAIIDAEGSLNASESDTAERLRRIGNKAALDGFKLLSKDNCLPILKAYFKTNTRKEHILFAVSLLVLISGLGLVVTFLGNSTTQPRILLWSGLATQLISGLFLVIYRLTVSQSNAFSGILERLQNSNLLIAEHLIEINASVNLMAELPDEQRNFAIKKATIALLDNKESSLRKSFRDGESRAKK